MISIDDLRKIARLKGLTNTSYAEKDYILDVALLSISRNTKDELVFKGGTCLYKFYKMNRFSEDIDFTLIKEIDVDGLLKKIVSDMALFGIESEAKDRKTVVNSIMARLKAKGPLYKGTIQSLSSIRVDINMKSSVDLGPTTASYNSLYPDVPHFSLLIMQEGELLAEKVRAVMTRTKARDLYDLWFLVEQKGVTFDKELVEKKLRYYAEKWNFGKFSKRFEAFSEATWERELKPLVLGRAPDFETVRRSILKKVSKA